MQLGGMRGSLRELYRRAPHAVVVASLGLLGILLGVDAAGGRDVRLGGVMLAVPPLAAIFTGPGSVLIVSAVMLPSFTGSLALNGRLTWAQDAPVSLGTAVLICAAAVLASAVREHRERELAQSRKVTRQTQQILLRPLPNRLGQLEISSLYLASDDESLLGGDVYACAVVDGRPRILLGDVRGKGLGAIEVVMFLLVAFRRAAQQRIGLADLPAYLDEAIRSDLAQARDMQDEGGCAHDDTEMDSRLREGFVTAVIVEADHTGDEVRIANCGHPPPLFLHGGDFHELRPTVPSLPLGLLGLDHEPVRIDAHRLAEGDKLLLYTDGLIEARNDAGEFYPLSEGVERWGALEPTTMLDSIHAELNRHTRSHLVDDVAMVTVRRDVGTGDAGEDAQAGCA
jgi:serine phosphatase RsbU (regulator of sigma subunit)